MKVRKLRTSYSPAEGVTKPGDIIEVDDNRARQLIESRLAEAVMPGDGERLTKRRPGRVAARTAKPKERPARPTPAPASPAGGQTGAAKSASSSAAAPAPTGKTSDKPKGGRK